MNIQLISTKMRDEGYTPKEIEDYLDHVADDERRERQEREYEEQRKEPA